MKVEVEPGRYIVAVSGGVDSAALLDILSRQPGLELIVAHFDHGIRLNSALDRKFVENIAGQYQLKFEFGEGDLGRTSSEAEARQARYDFLNRVRDQYQADAIITAHHQDDLIETAIINMLRGTGRRGLSSLGSTDKLKRPLLDISKKDLIRYAQTHNLTWREDPSNQNLQYKRNYVRHKIVPLLTPTDRKKLLDILRQSAHLNNSLDGQINSLIKPNISYNNLDRQWFASLPHKVAKEVLLYWLRQQGVTDLDRRQVESLTVNLKTHGQLKRFSINNQTFIVLTKQYLALQHIDR